DDAVAERWQYVDRAATHHVVDRLPTRLLEVDITGHRLLDRDPMHHCWGDFHHRAGHGFGLREIQHLYAVSRHGVVGGAKLYKAVLVAAEIAAQHPTARTILGPTLPAEASAPPEQRLPVGLAPALQPAAGAAAG